MNSSMDLYDGLFKKTTTLKFKEGVIQEIMKLNSSDPKLRFSADSISAIEEVVRSFTVEIIWRTANQASNEGLNSVNIEHLEKIIPQLLLDYA